MKLRIPSDGRPLIFQKPAFYWNHPKPKPAKIGNQGGDGLPPDFGGKSWQGLDFCWQVLRILKKLSGFEILPILKENFGRL